MLGPVSVDYISYACWLRPASARRVVAEPSSQDAELEAPDGTVVFRPGIDRRFRPKALARAVGARPPSPEDLHVSVADMSMLGASELERFGVAVMSSNFPLLPLIDRVLAIPAGVRFMEGLAYARLRPNRRSRLAKEWPALLDRFGGAKAAARVLVPFIDRGGDAEEEARAMIAGVTKALRIAEARDRDLVLLGVDLST
jgi:hypothetical protein